MSNTPLNVKALWDLYDERNPQSRPARTLHFGRILRWAEQQPDIAYEPEGDFYYRRAPAPVCTSGVPPRFCTCVICMPPVAG
jgi:hypothetical protein